MTLSEWLNSQSMTAAGLAERLAVEPSTISRWLSGQRFPSGTQAAKLVEVTGGAVDLNTMVPKAAQQEHAA